MTQEFKDMIDRLAVARNHDGGNFLLATVVPPDTKIEIRGGASTAFLIAVVSVLIDDVLNNAPSDTTFNNIRSIILGKIADAEVKRFQQREIKEDDDADA